MNKIKTLTLRNLKEIIRDPLSLVFCMGFPVVMLLLMQIIFASIKPVPENFKLENYAVGICIFGYTFAMMFTAMLIASDKNSEFISRIYMSPIKKSDYLLSYVLSGMPIVFCQTLIFFIIATALGLEPSPNQLVAIVYLIPSMLFYIVLGVLLGTLCKTEKQAGPISSIIISATSMLGGVFMPIDGLGAFSKINGLLPFSHTTKIASGALVGNYSCIYPHIFWVLGWTAFVFLITLLIRKLSKN